jgi:hypothetical protein
MFAVAALADKNRLADRLGSVGIHPVAPNRSSFARAPKIAAETVCRLPWETPAAMKNEEIRLPVKARERGPITNLLDRGFFEGFRKGRDLNGAANLSRTA